MPSKTTTSIPDNVNERVMVFIDGSNLYHVLDQNCSRHDVQFDKFAKKLANGRSLRRIYYYNIRQESDRNDGRVDQDRFLHSLYETPYVEVRLGVAKQRRDHVVEKGVDVMLATDLVVRAYQDQYDTAILVSGDGDFYPGHTGSKGPGQTGGGRGVRIEHLRRGVACRRSSHQVEQDFLHRPLDDPHQGAGDCQVGPQARGQR